MSSTKRASGDLDRWTGDWALDPEKTTVRLRTKTLWVVPVKITVRPISGNAQIGQSGAVNGTLVIDADSFTTKNTKRDQHLRSDAILAASRYPSIAFTVNGGRMAGPGHIEVSGVLTVRGRSQPLTLDAQVRGTENSATVSAEVKIDRRLWDVTWPGEARMGAGHDNHVAIRAHFDRVS